jgi:hypothetical protein
VPGQLSNLSEANKWRSDSRRLSGTEKCLLQYGQNGHENSVDLVAIE